MSKIKHWDEVTQSWVIDGASNAANIELTNPGYLDENGDSISVDQGFTKVDNRINKLEKNVAWIYQNGAIGGGGGGGGGGGTIDSTEYTISIEEGNRVYTATNSIKIHMTINGGSLRKTFQVDITNASTGEKLASPVVVGLTRTEITINNIAEGLQTLKISAHTGLYYASDFILTVIGGAIKLTKIRVTNDVIYPTSIIDEPIFTVTNSTDSNLLIKVSFSKDHVNYSDLFEKTIEQAQFTVPEISSFLTEKAQTDIGETYTFRIYAQGVLNDNILQSNVIEWSTAIIEPRTLYILTYGVNKAVPENEGSLETLNRFVYGQYVQFWYRLTYTDATYPTYDINYSVAPCYFEQGVLVSRQDLGFEGTVTRVTKDVQQPFSFSTASLPSDTIYDTTSNQYKFIKVTLTATSVDRDDITDTKVLYFTLSKPVEKFITATNFDRSLICYYSPVIGVPTGNVNTWRYDNRNLVFPYSSQGLVQQRYIDLVGYNINGIRNGYSSQGIHLTGKSYALLETNLFSSQANEVNLITGTSGFTISTTFRTNANIDDNAVVMSLGKYEDEQMTAGIEIIASQVRVYVNKQITSLNITKGDLVSIDIIFEKYVGIGDTSDSPNHWFVKIYLNGVLSSLGSYDNNVFISNVENTAWFFDQFLCLGAHVDGDDVISAADVHFYDFKMYSTALSDNEIIQNYISANIYAELDNGENPSTTKQNEMLSNNFISINTEGEFESMLFDVNDQKLYKDDDTLLATLRTALADSKIPYPIVVINQKSDDANFFGITQAQFSEDQKAIITSEDYRYPIYIDYYTMGNATATRIENSDRMKISIQGTSSLQFFSKNYEIYMGTDEEGKDVLVQMREDWLPENEFTLKADVMDSAHVNNVLIGRIINGMVSTTDQSGNEVAIRPLSNTPPMNVNNEWASKIKHTSEGYPVILFINFRNSSGTICKCQGIYNFNLGRAASFNLGLKLLSDCTFVDNAVTFPRMVENYTQNLTVSNGAPVYSIEIGENNQQIGAFDQDSPDVLSSGIFDTIYHSDGSTSQHLQRLLTFLARFGANVQNPKKVLVNNQWCTPKLVKNGSVWEESGQYYLPENNANYVQTTLEMHMNWNNLIAYYIIAIVFGLVDSMGKNLTLRTWNQVPDENGVPQCVWYMCFYDMDTAMRLDNDGNETVPYNAHIHRYYTETPNNGASQSRVTLHSDTIPGLFTQVYSAYNTRLQEIAENLKEVAKTLSDIYVDLRSTLFPNPGEFIDKYYTGQINQIGAALYNYDYKIKYLQTKKSYSVANGELLSSNDYNQISYLHGNGTTNIKSWFKKRIRFLDGVYAVRDNGTSLLDTSVSDVTLGEIWSNNQITKSSSDPDYLQVTLCSESQTFVNISAGESAKATLWLSDTPTVYSLPNVSGTQRLSVYGNQVITQFDGFEKFRWTALNDITFPLVRSLSLENAQNINASAFLNSQSTSGLESLRRLNLHGVVLNRDSNVVYQGITFTQNLPNLEWLDISNSTINAVRLPESGVLKYLNLKGTRISVIQFDGQPMLETLILDDCLYLTSISLRNCPKLKTLYIPSSVRTIELQNCPGLERLECAYNGRETSSLESIIISACDGLKVINLAGQNNPNLSVRAEGAYNLEQLLLSGIATTDIILPRDLTSLKYVDLSRTSIMALNFGGTVSSILDLSRNTNLQKLKLQSNSSVREVRCPNIEGKYITLDAGAFQDCTNLVRLIGNFMIAGTGVFINCRFLILNTSYSSIVITTPYVSGEFCNITFSDSLYSCSEMFSGCSSIKGQDFRYIMARLKPQITSLNRMFYKCESIKVSLWPDLFNKCPNVTDITSFCEETKVCGAFYSSNEGSNGILEYIPNLSIANYAFASTDLEWIDDNTFKHNNVITQADYMFSNCQSLHSCEDTWDPEEGGYLHSKDYFLNLTHLNSIVPTRMFGGCIGVKMIVDSDEIETGLWFDYLFHYPESIDTTNITSLDNSLYSGVILSGTIHNNVFGSLRRTYNGYKIPNYTIINGPFAYSSGELHADLNTFGSLFRNMNPTSLISVLSGITFNSGSTNHIPNDIFQGCTKLTNISGFFSNDSITNNGDIYEFPAPQLFQDCIKLQRVDSLFQNTHFLNIKLVGNGFINNPISICDRMLYGSGVFGTIPYKFLRTSGKTITSMNAMFSNCFRLGYTVDRVIEIGIPYYSGNAREPRYTVWEDAVILDHPGTEVKYTLDYENYDNIDEYYIDGRDWTQEMKSLDIYDSRITEYAGENYIVPADIFYSVVPGALIDGVFNGLTYSTSIVSDDEEGKPRLVEYQSKAGLSGRIPLKIFKPLSESTSINGVFSLLNIVPFRDFDSQGYIGGLTSQQCRGILFPPDLFSYTPNIKQLSRTFSYIDIPAGVDVNLNVGSLADLEDINGLFYCCTFHDSPVSDGTPIKQEDVNLWYPQIATNTFHNNSKLRDVSDLFCVPTSALNTSNYVHGLLHVDAEMFKPGGEFPLHPYLQDISMMFYYNTALSGTVPLMQGQFITSWSGYISGVDYSRIQNIEAFKQVHDESWYDHD